jgi:hypothetical protein
MTFDPAVHFQIADDPRKVALLLDPVATDPKPTTIAELLEFGEDTIVVGTHFSDDIFRTTFDRFTGLALDNGRLKTNTIPPKELARLERFAAEGAYKTRPAEWGQVTPAAATPAQVPVHASAPAPVAAEAAFDPDAFL